LGKIDDSGLSFTQLNNLLDSTIINKFSADDSSLRSFLNQYQHVEFLIDSALSYPEINFQLDSAFLKLLNEIQFNPSIEIETLDQIFTTSLPFRINHQGLNPYLSHLSEREMKIQEDILFKKIDSKNPVSMDSAIWKMVQYKYDVSFGELDSIGEKYKSHLNSDLQSEYKKYQDILYPNYLNNFSNPWHRYKFNRYSKINRLKMIPTLFTLYLYPSFLFDVNAYADRLISQSSKAMTHILLRNSCEDHRDQIIDYHAFLSFWDITLLSLKMRIFEKENGHFPDNLELLNLPQINKDPFNKFRSYQLKSAENGKLLYGYGYDRKNDGGNNLILLHPQFLIEEKGFKKIDFGLHLKSLN